MTFLNASKRAGVLKSRDFPASPVASRKKAMNRQNKAFQSIHATRPQSRYILKPALFLA